MTKENTKMVMIKWTLENCGTGFTLTSISAHLSPPGATASISFRGPRGPTAAFTPTPSMESIAALTFPRRSATLTMTHDQKLNFMSLFLVRINV